MQDFIEIYEEITGENAHAKQQAVIQGLIDNEYILLELFGSIMLRGGDLCLSLPVACDVEESYRL